MLPDLHRRPLTFSLRTFLLLFAVAGICLGVVSQRAREQRRAVAALQRVFAEIEYECDTESRQTSQRSALDPSVDYRHSVVQVILDAPAVNDETLVHLRAFPKLRCLMMIEGTKVTSDGLGELRDLRHLKQLILSIDTIDDRGLETIAQLSQLEDLWLHNLRITDAGLQRLSALKKLRYLWIDAAEVTEEGVTRLQLALPHCKIDY